MSLMTSSAYPNLRCDRLWPSAPRLNVEYEATAFPVNLRSHLWGTQADLTRYLGLYCARTTVAILVDGHRAERPNYVARCWDAHGFAIKR